MRGFRIALLAAVCGIPLLSSSVSAQTLGSKSSLPQTVTQLNNPLGSPTDAAAALGATSASMISLGKEWANQFAAVTGAAATPGTAAVSSQLVGCVYTNPTPTMGQQTAIRCDQYGELVTTAAISYFGGGIVGSNGAAAGAAGNGVTGGAINTADMNCSGGTCTPTNASNPKPVVQTGAIPTGTNTIGGVTSSPTSGAMKSNGVTTAATAGTASTLATGITHGFYIHNVGANPCFWSNAVAAGTALTTTNADTLIAGASFPTPIWWAPTGFPLIIAASTAAACTMSVHYQ